MQKNCGKNGHGKMRGRQKKRKRMNMKINQKKVMVKILKKNKEYFRLTRINLSLILLTLC